MTSSNIGKIVFFGTKSFRKLQEDRNFGSKRKESTDRDGGMLFVGDSKERQI